MLELENVRKHYASPGGAVRAIDGVCMRVLPSEVAAVYGPSGSGKTTLLLLAAGLMRADSGSVRVEGRDLARLSRREVLAYRRTKLGFVFQGFNLVAGMTAAENVALPLLLRGLDRKRAHRCALDTLAEMGLAHRAEHPATRLSGGEQQRVGIARALVGEPRVVLADEPTGNLDTETGDDVLGLLCRASRERGAATILVTHDSRASGYADRALDLRDGKLTDPGVREQATVVR
ncbi:MAG TPA: ABC transporter ATP-binding protein [Solirubrobacteraceae bacterium]|nr:ABC transporter ATP-binding protein [Solirubrobacteraceae bacterium]